MCLNYLEPFRSACDLSNAVARRCYNDAPAVEKVSLGVVSRLGTHGRWLRAKARHEEDTTLKAHEIS